MDEILASIRRIIHEEEETKQPVRPTGENTVVLSEERAAQAAAAPAESEAATVAEQLSDLQAVADSVEAAVTAPQPEDVEAVPAAETLTVPEPQEPPVAEIDDTPLHPEQPFEAISPSTLTAKPAASEATQLVAEPAPTIEPEPQEEVPAMPATQPVEQHAEIVEAATASLIGEQQSQNVAAAFASLKQHVQVTQQGGKTLEDMVAQMIQPMLKAWLNEHLPAIVERKVEEEVRRLSDH
ncbi:MAG: DUF2497 domain-containing protein [Pseudomonadota bacterium]